MKKPKRRRYKRRLLIYSTLVFVLLFSIIDYYCENFGLPEFARKIVCKKLQDRGFDLQFDDLKCGVVHGIRITNVKLKDSQLNLDNFLLAEQLKISITPQFNRSYFLGVSSVEIISGSLKIPMFPEFEEGNSDIVTLKNVNARIECSGNALNVLHLSGELSPFQFTSYGSFSNVFFPDIFDDNSPEDKKTVFSITPAIKSIAFESRASFYRELLKAQKDNLFTKGTPRCQLMLNVDVMHPQFTKMKAEISLPSFEYGEFSIQSVKAKLSYIENRVILDSLILKFPNNGELSMHGGWNNQNDLINASIEGRLTSEEISDILTVFDIKLPQALQITNSVPLKMTLKNFSLTANESKGELNIVIPEAKFRDLNIQNISAQLTFAADTLSATHLSFETNHNVINGNLDYNASSQTIDATFHSSGAPFFLLKLMGGENTKLMNSILSRFTFPKNDKDIELVADIHCSWGEEFFYFINGNMVMHSFKYLGIPFDSSDANIIIDSNEILIIPSITLTQKNSIATVAMIYDNSGDFEYHVESPAFRHDGSHKGQLLLEGQSSLPGDVVLKCIFPDWKSNMLDMSAPVNAIAEGVIDFSGNSINRTDFNVKISDSICKWYELPITELDCDLIFKGMNMDIKNVDAKVYGGDLDLAYYTNFNTGKGNIKIDLKNSDFVSMVKHIKWDLSGDGGKLSATTDALLDYDKDDNLLMTGKGTIEIKDANLWEVPLINSFGQLTSKWLGEKWGVISELNAEFKYKKDHIVSNNIQTNGDVVALKSNGKLFWTTGDFNFLVHAELLKTMLPFKMLTVLFDPITGLMENRVIRKNGEIKWEKISWYETFFRSK